MIIRMKNTALGQVASHRQNVWSNVRHAGQTNPIFSLSITCLREKVIRVSGGRRGESRAQRSSGQRLLCLTAALQRKSRKTLVISQHDGNPAGARSK